MLGAYSPAAVVAEGDVATWKTLREPLKVYTREELKIRKCMSYARRGHKIRLCLEDHSAQQIFTSFSKTKRLKIK